MIIFLVYKLLSAKVMILLRYYSFCRKCAWRRESGSGSTGRVPPPMQTSFPDSIPLYTYCLAFSTATDMGSPNARNVAMAEDKVHPVPCVFRLSTFGAVNKCGASSVAVCSTSHISPPSRCPPFDEHSFTS